MKSPVLATVLNVIPGFGYIYVGGKKRWFGLMLVLAIGLSLYATVSNPTYQQTLQEAMQSSSNVAQTDQVGLMSLGASILLIGAFMYDGYLSCQQANEAYDAKIKAKIKEKAKP